MALIKRDENLVEMRILRDLPDNESKTIEFEISLYMRTFESLNPFTIAK